MDGRKESNKRKERKKKDGSIDKYINRRYIDGRQIHSCYRDLTLIVVAVG